MTPGLEKKSPQVYSLSDVPAKRERILLASDNLCWVSHLEPHPAETHVFVTSGVQVWGPPVRTAGDSEILVVNVSFHNKTITRLPLNL